MRFFKQDQVVVLGETQLMLIWDQPTVLKVFLLVAVRAVDYSGKST